MNAEKDFLVKLTALAKLCNFQLTESIIELYHTHLAQQGFDKVALALDHLIVNRGSRDPFPSIKEVRSIVKPESDPRGAAVQVAGEIAGAIARISPYEPAKAKAELSDAAWQVVKTLGGWEQVVASADSHKTLTILQAHWRDLAMAQGSMPKPERAALPGPTERGSDGGQLVSFGDVMQKALAYKAGGK